MWRLTSRTNHPIATRRSPWIYFFMRHNEGLSTSSWQRLFQSVRYSQKSLITPISPTSMIGPQMATCCQEENLHQGWGGKRFLPKIPLLGWCDASLHSSQLEASKVDSFLLDHTVWLRTTRCIRPYWLYLIIQSGDIILLMCSPHNPQTHKDRGGFEPVCQTASRSNPLTTRVNRFWIFDEESRSRIWLRKIPKGTRVRTYGTIYGTYIHT